MNAMNATAQQVFSMNDPAWQQQTSEEQRRHDEELAEDWDNWVSKEPPWWKILEHRKWMEEQDGLRHISTE